MKVISVDYFDTLDENTTFWQELLSYAMKEGMKVFVISGPWSKELVNRLDTKGFIRNVHYNKVFSILSHLSGKGLDVWYDEDQDSWNSDSLRWWAAKAEICKKVKSQIHFDSDFRFRPGFREIATRFVHTKDMTQRAAIGDWHRELKLANTYDDWDEYNHIMGGMFIM